MLYMEQPPSPFTNPDIWIDETGRHVEHAGDRMMTDPKWVARMFPSMLHGDELWLDEVGEWRYRESEDPLLRKAAGGFTAYERIQP